MSHIFYSDGSSVHMSVKLGQNSAPVLQITFSNVISWMKILMICLKNFTGDSIDKFALVQVMACCLFVAKPLPEPMVTKI